MVLKKSSAKKKINNKDNAEKINVSGYYSIIMFLVLLLIDRFTKIWALTLNKNIDYGIVAFSYIINTGAGFSIFQNQNVLLAWIAVIALGLIIYFYNSFPRTGFLLITAGIIGNLLDRLMYGYVIDFINFKIWPVFNAADSFIVIGVIVTIIIWWRKDKLESKSEKNTPKPKGRQKSVIIVKPSKKTNTQKNRKVKGTKRK